MSDYSSTSAPRGYEIPQPITDRIEQLERENQELSEDLIHTQKLLSKSEMMLEDIQTSFCDDDACPLFEPFTVENMWKWINSRSKAQTSLAEVKTEQFKDGFWRGFEFARMNPDSHDIQKHYQHAAKIRNGKDGE